MKTERKEQRRAGGLGRVGENVGQRRGEKEPLQAITSLPKTFFCIQNDRRK